MWPFRVWIALDLDLPLLMWNFFKTSPSCRVGRTFEFTFISLLTCTFCCIRLGELLKKGKKDLMTSWARSGRKLGLCCTESHGCESSWFFCCHDSLKHWCKSTNCAKGQHSSPEKKRLLDFVDRSLSTWVLVEANSAYSGLVGLSSPAVGILFATTQAQFLILLTVVSSSSQHSMISSPEKNDAMFTGYNMPPWQIDDSCRNIFCSFWKQI